MQRRFDEGGVDLYRNTCGWSVVVLRFEEIREKLVPRPPWIAEVEPIVDVLPRGVSPIVEIDGARSSKLFSTRMVNNAIVAVSLWYSVEDPVIVRIIPHGRREAGCENIWIFSAVKAGFNDANSDIWILCQPRCQREASSAASSDQVIEMSSREGSWINLDSHFVQIDDNNIEKMVLSSFAMSRCRSLYDRSDNARMYAGTASHMQSVSSRKQRVHSEWAQCSLFMSFYVSATLDSTAARDQQSNARFWPWTAICQVRSGLGPRSKPRCTVSSLQVNYMFGQLRSGCCCCGTMHAPHAKKKMLIVGSGMLDSAALITMRFGCMGDSRR